MYGGTSPTAVTYGMMGWTPSGDGQWTHDPLTGWSFWSAGTNPRTCTNVHVPNGALLSILMVNAEVGPGNILWELHVINLSNNTGTTPVSLMTSGPGTYHNIMPINPPITIDNTAQAYVLCTTHDTAGIALQNGGTTLWYYLQVSPAPATATFPNDVPTTHPLFRFVEAMAASGLTGGCGAGTFCPDAPLTRGQMAVFLSVALGLHFPN